MDIISRNNFYSYGVSSILDALYDEFECDFIRAEIKIYITTGSKTRSVLSLLREHPPSGHSLFICNKQVQVLMSHQVYSGGIRFIDEGTSVDDVRTALKTVILNFSNMAWRTSPKLTLPLTDREQEVFRLLMKGYRVDIIAKLFGISPKTVYSYKYNITAKNGMSRFNDFFCSLPEP